MSKPSFCLHFHPTPGHSSSSGSFGSKEEFDAYKDFEEARTSVEILAYRFASPAKRSKAAEALANKRKAVYANWRKLCAHLLPNGEIVV